MQNINAGLPAGYALDYYVFSVKYRPQSMVKSFVFLHNALKYEGDEPIEIIPNHTFNRANKVQIKKLKELLDRFIATPVSHERYETELSITQDKETGEEIYNRVIIPEKNWNYWVISFEGTNSELYLLSLAASLLKNDLEFGFKAMAHSLEGKPKEFASYQFPKPSFYSYYASDFFGLKKANTIVEKEIKNIGPIYELIKETVSNNEHVKSTLAKWSSLKSLPRDSEMLIIGLFAVIESVITHEPHLESSDSLTHQVKTKIPLLRESYFRRKLDYSEYFNEGTEEKVWKRLYSYRSKIVHGANSELNGNLHILNTKETVLNYLNEVVKLLLLVSLDYPKVVTNLQKC